MKPDEHARVTRRGQQLFHIALCMEVGYARQSAGGAEALLYLANAIAHVAALSAKPRLAIESVVSLFDTIDDGWLTKQGRRHQDTVAAEPHLLADTALEIALGQDVPGEDTGGVAARALADLTAAIVRVASLNSDPRRIIEHVVRRIDEADVDDARREQLK